MKKLTSRELKSMSGGWLKKSIVRGERIVEHLLGLNLKRRPTSKGAMTPVTGELPVIAGPVLLQSAPLLQGTGFLAQTPPDSGASLGQIALE